MAWTVAKARAHWAWGQGLLNRLSDPLPSEVAQTGWIRTLGGVDAYLAPAPRAEALLTDLGHSRVTSIDNAKSQARRLAQVHALG